MVDGGDPLKQAQKDKQNPNDLRSKLLGLPQRNEAADNTAGQTPLAERVWSDKDMELLACNLQAPGVPDFSRAIEIENKRVTPALNRFIDTPEGIGTWKTLTNSLNDAVEQRIKAIPGGRLAQGGTVVSRILMNINALKMLEARDGATDYTTDVIDAFDHTFRVVGTRGNKQPPPYDDAKVAEIEFRRLFGVMPDTVPRGKTPEINDRDVSNTVICENLREYFPINKKETANPWKVGACP